MLSDFVRPTDSVTPTKWKGPDGRVWERTGEKRQPKPGEYIWFDTAQPEPYPYGHPFKDAAAALSTAIWKLSEDQEWEPAPIEPATPPTIEELMKRAQFTEDSAELNRLLVLGVLQQTQELRRIADVLADFNVFSNRYRIAKALGEKP